MHSSNRHPPGLRGKAIGLYYARCNAQNRDNRPEFIHGLPRSLKDSINSWRISHSTSSASERERGAPCQSQSRHKALFKMNKDPDDNWGEDSGSEDDPTQENDPSLIVRVPKPCPSLDIALLKEQKKKLSNPSTEHKRILDSRENLPAWSKREVICSAIEKNQVIVISGETGCGKTTQVPQFILDEAISQGRGTEVNILCTQPRRISAISVSKRVAIEHGDSSHGKAVGYQIRLESSLPRDNASVIFCTTGVPLQWMKSNPLLKGISHVILDEIHERDTLSDFFLTLLKDILTQRKDLKLILMSATLNANQFSKYFDKCPVIEIPGRVFPVKEYYLEDVLEMTKFDMTVASKNDGQSHYIKYKEHLHFFSAFLRDIEDRYSDSTMNSLSSHKSEEFNPELIATLILYIHSKEPPGAILVFLSGWSEISNVHRLLTEDRRYSRVRELQIYPLHSLMPSAYQSEIFDRPPRGLRKVILATNIAETSITIDDVVYVVDTGKIKLLDFDRINNVDRLEPRWISSANARQRQGRAGRVQPGICYRLFTSYRSATFDSYVKPEILRTRLDEVILNIKVLGLGPAAPFLSKLMEPPESESIHHAIEFLWHIKALQRDEQLTHLGLHMAELPMSPQIGRMLLLGAIFSCLDPILTIAASLNFKDPFVVPLGMERNANNKKEYISRGSNSDHLTLVTVMKKWEQTVNKRKFCWNYFLSDSNLRMIQKLKRQFAEQLCEKKFIRSKDMRDPYANANSGNMKLIKSIVAAGLYPNVAKVSGKKGRTCLRTSKLNGISFHSKSILANRQPYTNWIVFHIMLKGESSTKIMDASPISPLALIFWGSDGTISSSEKGEEDEVGQLRIDDLIQFSGKYDLFDNILAVKDALNSFIEDKMRYPEPVDWSISHSSEVDLLNLYIRLIDHYDFNMN